MHLPNKVECFGFVGYYNIDCLAFLLLLGELTTKGDDVGHVGHPCLVESRGCFHAFPCHELSPVCSEMVKDTFDGVVDIAEVLIVEFLHVLLLNVVNDALDANVGDRFLQVKFLFCLLVSS